MNWIEDILYELGQFFRDIFTQPITVKPVDDSLPTPLPPSPALPNVLVWDNPINVRHSIRVLGDEYGLTPHQKDLLCDIARCESEFNPKATLKNSPKSIDRGLYQWNSYYHPEITDAIAYDPEQNTRIAIKALKAHKCLIYWNASAKCWNKDHRYDDIA